MFKKISVVTLVLVMMLSVFSLCVAATEVDGMDIAPAPDASVFETAPLDEEIDIAPLDEEIATDNAKKVQFKPMAFVENLNIMGVGMLGIFIVIGAIILSVVVLGKITAPKPEKKDE